MKNFLSFTWHSVFRSIGVLLATILVLNAFPARAASVTLAWDRNPEPDIAGYRVYFGTTTLSYTANIDAGNNPLAVLPNLAPTTTYFVVVTAYNSVGLESLPSEEISFSTGSDPLADIDLDGLPDIWETLHGLDPADDGTGLPDNGASGDPDRDGISNLLEYGFGFEPQVAEAGARPTVGILDDSTDGLRYLTIRFRKRLNATTLTYTVQSSSDLRSWEEAIVEEAEPPVATGDGESVLVTYRVLPGFNPLTPPQRVFARVAVATVALLP